MSQQQNLQNCQLLRQQQQQQQHFPSGAHSYSNLSSFGANSNMSDQRPSHILGTHHRQPVQQQFGHDQQSQSEENAEEEDEPEQKHQQQHLAKGPKMQAAAVHQLMCCPAAAAMSFLPAALQTSATIASGHACG
uniref:Uncharacterized protein n=1 Tax=Globodera rostochiensis TaxID=31243 RepID=A0A914IGY7_GLORO